MLTARLALLLCCVAGGALAEGDVDVDANTKMILVGFRHGNRNPCGFFAGDDGSWAVEGPCQLTKVGKSQAYAFGRSLRTRYAALLPAFPSVDAVKPMSSNSERTQMTLQLVLAGAFPPADGTFADWDGDFDPPIHWQPVGYKIADAIVKMSALKDCEAQKVAYKPIKEMQLPWMKETFVENRALFDYIAEHTGRNVTGSYLGDVGDIAFNMKLFGRPLPDWIEKPTLEGWPGGSLYDKLEEFSEFNQRACAGEQSCAKMFSGSWLKDIIDRLGEKEAGESDDIKAVFYASHSRYALSAMRMMFMDYAVLPTSAGFVLEYRQEPQPAVRLLYHEPQEEDFSSGRNLVVAQLMDGAGCKAAADANDGWCPLDTFVAAIEPNSLDYKAVCYGEGAEGGGGDKGGKIVVIERDCATLEDKMKSCATWVANFPGYCDRDDAKHVFCQKTCLCK